jgi:hypothetical protein
MIPWAVIALGAVGFETVPLIRTSESASAVEAAIAWLANERKAVIVWVLCLSERPFRPMPKVLQNACQFLKTAQFCRFLLARRAAHRGEWRVNATYWGNSPKVGKWDFQARARSRLG